MKRVGIVTLHFSINYGAVLQCLALEKTLEKLGCRVEVINYYPRYAKYYWEPQKHICDAIHDVLQKKNSINNNLIYECLRATKYVVQFNCSNADYKRKYSKFKKFASKNLNLTKEYSSIEELRTVGYDALITGSDQVWNSDYTDFKFDPVYFLNFGANSAKRIAYGVSMHLYDNKEDWKKLSLYANRLNAISVREKSVQERIEATGYFGPCKTVLDPTLLLKKEEWINYESTEIKYEEDFVLVYSLKEKEKCCDLANKIASKKNFRIVDISPISICENSDWVSDCAPADFLYYVHHSKYVVTDSFHGTVFSIVYNKQFVSVAAEKSKDSRILNLLKSLGLECCISYNFKNLIQIEYDQVNILIEKMKEQSINYIVSALEE